MGRLMPPCQSQEGRFQNRPKNHGEAQAHNHLQNLSPPKGLNRKMNCSLIQKIGQNHAKQGSQKAVGIFYALGQIFGIHIPGKGGQLHIEHKGQGAGGHGGEQGGEDPGPPAVHRRFDQKHQGQSRPGGSQNVCRGVDAQIHPGKGDQNHQNAAQNPDPGPPGTPAQDAKGPYGILRVTAGKAIACGICPGRFYNGKFRVQHPGPGHTAQELQKLIEHRAEKAHRQ